MPTNESIIIPSQIARIIMSTGREKKSTGYFMGIITLPPQPGPLL